MTNCGTRFVDSQQDVFLLANQRHVVVSQCGPQRDTDIRTDVRSQKAVTAYFKSEKLLPFDFALQLGGAIGMTTSSG